MKFKDTPYCQGAVTGSAIGGCVISLIFGQWWVALVLALITCFNLYRDFHKGFLNDPV